MQTLKTEKVQAVVQMSEPPKGLRAWYLKMKGDPMFRPRAMREAAATVLDDVTLYPELFDAYQAYAKAPADSVARSEARTRFAEAYARNAAHLEAAAREAREDEMRPMQILEREQESAKTARNLGLVVMLGALAATTVAAYLTLQIPFALAFGGLMVALLVATGAELVGRANTRRMILRRLEAAERAAQEPVATD